MKVRYREPGITTTQKVFASVWASVVATCIGLLLSATVDRDSVVPALLFPYAMLTMYVLGNDGLFLLLGLPQFFVYGAVFAWAWICGRGQRGPWRLFILHLIVGVGCAMIYRADLLCRLWSHPRW
jgi:hypothetical protein